ncbi:MAG TPA: hypothetical protein VFE52_11190 [Devosia sp.]|jgi:hypothetical protein|nr:hypothetical protein [Devosia sp.]
MIAILLYIIGLISALITAVVVGFEIPDIYRTLVAAYDGGWDDVLRALARAARNLGWALVPFLGGLLLMGFARIMILLGSINRALRGPA